MTSTPDAHLTRLLREVVGRSPAGPMPLEALIEGGRRLQKRRRRRAALGVAATVLTVAGGTTLAQTAITANESTVPATRPEGRGPGEWVPLPPAPLSARAASIPAWTGTEVLFIGGQDHPDCYSGSLMGCPRPAPISDDLTDGAAYNPEAGSWRNITDAPVPLSDRYSSVVVGDRVVIAAAEQGYEPTWLVYDASEDTWTILPTPMGIGEEPELAADDSRVYVIAPYPREGRILALDLDSESWSALPARPEAEKIVGPALVGLDDGVAVIGLLAPATKPDSPVTIEVYDRHAWRTTIGDGVLAANRWYWTGERLIAPVPDYSPEIRAGAAYNPSDPKAGFSEVPLGPTHDQPDLYVPQVAADGSKIAADGFVYDDATKAWTRLPTPATRIGVTAPLGGIAAAWAGDSLVTFGGFVEISPMSGRTIVYETPTAAAWIWSP